MLPIKLKIPEGFLEEEERNGYTVSREMKELWAVSLDLIREILEACEAKGIKVFAGYGTLLGAVRHGGFIPWDNDSDLFMMREDICIEYPVSSKASSIVQKRMSFVSGTRIC